ncbi:mechanosensitive ion channel family protein [Acidobacteriota bacterium]
MMTWIENIAVWLSRNPALEQLLYILLVIFLCYVAYVITKKIILKLLGRLAEKTQNKFDDIILNKKVTKKAAFIPSLLIINFFAYLVPSVAFLIQRFALALIFFIILTTISAFLLSLHKIYKQKKEFAKKPIKGYVQTFVLIIYIMGKLVLIGILSGQSPLVLFSGIGALTAVLLLIFRDTILSFIASIQITTNDLVRLGDWIEVPAFKADGDVIDIALHTIKIQNFNKTITVIPTHKLIDASFKNWRGMKESGGRRIKRSLFIDLNSIRFCDEKMIKKFERIELLKDYIKNKKEEIEQHNREKNTDMSSKVNDRRLTNLGTFRAYIDAYLRNHEKIKQNLTFLIRQLQPGPTGLPIEIYVFTDDTVWANYEAIQADIFDHFLAGVKEFDLQVFQYSSDPPDTSTGLAVKD